MNRADVIWEVCLGQRPAADAAACAPAPRGRPAAPPPHPDTARAAALARENTELRFALEAARWRTELALVMPEVLGGAPAPPPPAAKKKRRRGREGRDGG